MNLDRNARRNLKRNAAKVATIMASTCTDFSGGREQLISHPKAVDALRRAYKRMLAAGGKSMAVPISEEAAMGFPVRQAKPMPGPLACRWYRRVWMRHLCLGKCPGKPSGRCDWKESSFRA